ncbi:MAG: peptidase S41 [Acidobacteria bacterium]|nr:MAG: peptidase S41 [Acidobacteriota bacterium]PYY21657.1 MAG: peptidase S41 [Acidobacteriota bacterium]
MSKHLKIGVLSLSFLMVLFVVLGGLGVHAASSNNDGAYRQLGVYSEVLSRIRTEYVEEPNFSAVTSGALHGLLDSLDANSSYLNPEEYKFYKSHQNDGHANIGATISRRFGYAAVVSVLPGGPADKAGVQTGDIIEAIEGKSTHEMSLAAVEEQLAGKQGSNIEFAVVRPGKAEPQKITVTRDNIAIPGTTDKMMEDGIADIQPVTLTKGKAQEIASKIREEQKKGAKKLILDLRNVSEGDAAEAAAVANLFLNHGTITYLQGQKYPKQMLVAEAQKAITNLPLVVLVNRGTAGPGEIVAAAILDNNRGDLVGDKTFGSGSIQKVIDIPDGSALILSVAKYYTPSGKAIEDNAVTPNVVVASNIDDLIPDDEDGEAAPAPQEKPKQPKDDDQLRRAVEVLKARS